LGHSESTIKAMTVHRIQCRCCWRTARRVGKRRGARGVSRRRAAMPPRLPMPVRATASYPRPCIRYFCPGRTMKTIDSSGAEKKMLGMVLRMA
jgi:hypothetical protein